MTAKPSASSSLIAFISICFGIVLSFITMGLVQESLTKKTYTERNLKNQLVYLPIALQSLICLAIAYGVMVSRKYTEHSLLFNRDLMYASPNKASLLCATSLACAAATLPFIK